MSEVLEPATQLQSGLLKKIADLIEALEVFEKKTGVYMDEVALKDGNGIDYGKIADPDGTGYAWYPAGVQP